MFFLFHSRSLELIKTLLSLFILFSLFSCDVIELHFCFCSNAMCFRLLHTFTFVLGMLNYLLISSRLREREKRAWNTMVETTILTCIWVLHAPNASWNMLFSCFLHKKRKKGRNSWAKCVFEHAHIIFISFLYHSFLYSLLSHFFPVSIHYPLTPYTGVCGFFLPS